MKYSLSAVLMLCLTGLFSFASASEKSLLIGIGLSKPPYVIQSENAGAEYDLVARALEIAGYKMVPRYMPLRRVPHAMNGGILDGATAVRPHMNVDGFLSNEVIKYQNYAISHANAGLKLNSLADLSKLRVVAFQNASNLLGGSFKAAVKDNSEYREVANQELQIRLLAAGRTDIVISDFRIFLHFKRKVAESTGKTFKVRFHRLFAPTPYGVAFRKREVRDAFDLAIDEMRRSGEYNEILRRYISTDDLKAIY